ncbi:MAG: C40 family peptidase [Flavobacteriaceae bacterium]|jgi:lipoprotein Spr|nr:C40 family peptidase [Flavobacteriaceae bacterium]
MKSLLKLFTVVLIISATTTSCVSNYVVSNNNSKYPSTYKLLASHNPKSPKGAKGPNAAVDEKKLVSEKNRLAENKTSVEKSNIHAEKEFSDVQNLIREARTYLGTPYRYGGTTRNGIDCSSFVQHVFDAFDILLPRTSSLQSQKGTRVSKGELKKGDLIFFSHSPRSRISHVGIVESISPEGEIFFIHASSSQGVTITSLDTAYWKARFRAGKRILNPAVVEDNSQEIQEPQNEEAEVNLVKVSF